MDLERAISKANPQNKFLHSTLIQQSDRFNASTSVMSTVIKESLEIINKSASKQTAKPEKSGKAKKNKDHDFKANCTLECCMPVEKAVCTNCCDGLKSCDQNERSCDCPVVMAMCAEKPDDYISPDVVNVKPVTKGATKKATSFIVRDKNGSETLKHIGNVRWGQKVDTEDSDFYREIDYVEPIPEWSLSECSLSPEQIEMLPQFINHTFGEPNNVSKLCQLMY